MKKKYDYLMWKGNSKKSKVSISGNGAASSDAKTNDRSHNKKNASPLPRIPEEESSKSPRSKHVYIKI